MHHHTIAAAISFASLACAGQSVVRTYDRDSAVFPNPERGWIWTNQPFCSGTTALSFVAFDELRARSITLVDQVYVIDQFRDAQLSESFLSQFESEAAIARREGMKIVPRFTYNWIASCTGVTDAPASVIEQHLAQLAPVLARNADVLAMLQLSFIGRYGELHSSTNGHVMPGSVLFGPSGLALANKILATVPVDRAWCLRYAKQKIAIYPSPIDPTEAYSGSARARIGFADHGFASDVTGFGSWDPNPAVREQEKQYVASETRFVPQIGEPGGVIDPAFALNGQYVLGELERLHYTGLVINQGDAINTGVYDAWTQQGATDVIDRNLGYRYYLAKANVPDTAFDRVTVVLSIENDGFAVPINARSARIALRPQFGGEIIRLDSGVSDIRVAFPAAGDSADVTLDSRLPDNLPDGTYEVMISLHDDAPSIADRPEYAIRLASLGVWELDTGMNNLGLTVEVTRPPCERTGDRTLDESDVVAGLQAIANSHPNADADGNGVVDVFDIVDLLRCIGVNQTP